MTSTALRLILTAAIATASIAPAAAHAEPAGGGSAGGSSGKSCQTESGGTVEDGYVGTFRTKYERGSVTCTNGTLCTSTGVLQGDNKTRVWHYECRDANGATYRVVKRCTKRNRWRCTIARTSRPEAVKPLQNPAGAGQAQPSPGAGSPAAGAIAVAPATGVAATSTLAPRGSDGVRSGAIAIVAR